MSLQPHYSSKVNLHNMGISVHNVSPQPYCNDTWLFEPQLRHAPLNLSSLYNLTQLSSFSTWHSCCRPVGTHHSPTPLLPPPPPPPPCLSPSPWGGHQKLTSEMFLTPPRPSSATPPHQMGSVAAFWSLLAGLQAVALAVVLKEWNIHGAPS